MLIRRKEEGEERSINTIALQILHSTHILRSGEKLEERARALRQGRGEDFRDREEPLREAHLSSLATVLLSPSPRREARGNQPRKQKAPLPSPRGRRRYCEASGEGTRVVVSHSPVEYPVGVEVKVEQQLFAAAPRDRGTITATIVLARGGAWRNRGSRGRLVTVAACLHPGDAARLVRRDLQSGPESEPVSWLCSLYRFV